MIINIIKKNKRKIKCNKTKIKINIKKKFNILIK